MVLYQYLQDLLFIFLRHQNDIIIVSNDAVLVQDSKFIWEDIG